MCLNDSIVENFCLLEDGKFGTDKMPGVKPYIDNTYTKTQLLFGGSNSDNEGFFYVIPRGQNEDVNIKINYGVLTIDPSLAGTLSGTKDFGSEIENQIYKEAIFGEGIDFEAGKQYEIHIHLGMTSVKIEAVVEDWIDNGVTEVDLPDNQPEGQAEPAGANNNIEVGNVFHFSSEWDSDASAKITAINGNVVTISVKGSQADGTYYVNLDDFGIAITPATADTPAQLNSGFEAPVYKTAEDAEAQQNYLFKVTIGLNA